MNMILRLPGPPRSAARPALIVLAVVSIVIAGIATIALSDRSPGVGWAWPIIAVSTVWLIVYGISAHLYFRTSYLFTSAYVMSLVVFHLGLLGQYTVAGIDSPGWSGLDVRWLSNAGWYTVIALASLGLGFSAACLLSRKARERHRVADVGVYASTNLSRVRNLGYGLALASGLLVLLAIAQLGNILKYTRFELFYLVADTRSIGVFTMFAPSAALAMVLTAQTKTQRRFGYLFAIAMLGILLLSGYRSVALFPLLAGIVVWVKLGRRIPVGIAVAVLFSVLFIIPIAGYLRSLGPYDRLTLQDFIESTNKASVGDAFASMGSALGILATTIESIPKDEQYRYGRSYVSHLQSALPNLGFTMDLSNSRAEIYQAMQLNREARLRLAPSDWASLVIIPTAFLQGHGVGFSAIAEPYLNFGYAGVVVFFVLLGIFLARFDQVPLLLSYRWLTFATIFFWNMLVTVRNDFGVFTKPAIFTAICLGLWIAVRRFVPVPWLQGRNPQNATLHL